jgi:sugar lactone lactonase YvrE
VAASFDFPSIGAQRVLPLLALAFTLAACGFEGSSEDTDSTGDDSAGTNTISTLSLFTGHMGGSGNADGTGSIARLYNPQGIAVDGDGNLIVSDTFNQLIRVVSPTGIVSTLAGSTRVTGSTDGSLAETKFSHPCGLDVAPNGDIYLADRANHIIRVISAEGQVSTLAGTAGSQDGVDGTGADARFSDPCDVALDSNGNIFVADGGNHIIRKITPAGVVSTFAGSAGVNAGTDGTGSNARFYSPQGIVADSSDNLYVADSGNRTIRKITPSAVVTTLAGSAGQTGSTDDSGSNARFGSLGGITIDGSGNLFVADVGNVTIRKVTSGGVVTTLAGSAGLTGSDDGTGFAARFKGPWGMAIDGQGDLYVTDFQNHNIRKVTPEGVVTTIVGMAEERGSNDGELTSARFFNPWDLAADIDGTLYIADTSNYTVRRISPDGQVATIAGTAGQAGSTDGTGADARFASGSPMGIAVDPNGDVVATDRSNKTIRKVTALGVVTTLAGAAGESGSADGSCAEARFNNVYRPAIDKTGNIYVADLGDATIRKITPACEVSTLAGTPGQKATVDGTGSAARFEGPYDVATDADGNLYVADTNGSTIRKVTAEGVVTTIAGAPSVTGSSDGTGSEARFNLPFGIAVADNGTIYVADTYNHTIRKITPEGVVTTVVGVAGQGGFAEGSLPGLLSFPRDVEAHGSALYIALYNGIAVVTPLP